MQRSGVETMDKMNFMSAGVGRGSNHRPGCKHIIPCMTGAD